MSPLRVARLWAADYVFALLGLVAAARSGPEAGTYLTAGSGPRRTVVVVPGVWEPWRFMRPTIVRLHAAGHPVHVLTDLGRNSGTVAVGAARLADHLRRHDLRDVAIVAHSKGGLIGKYAMALLDPESRIERMVAVATPFSGSRYAALVPLSSIRAFRPNDRTTRLLAARTAENARITSIWAEFDPHIPGGSALPGATNVRVPDVGHFRILGTAAVQRAVDEALAHPL